MSESKEISLSDIKKIECEILDYIDSVCKKHDIPYFLFYGTLLGAVRHKGFIPWDDDIDVVMLRKDYMRFLEVVSQETGRYQTLSLYNDPQYYYTFAKVVDTRTKLTEEYMKPIDAMGVWVDIFPLDDMDEAKRTSLKLKLLKLQWAGSARRKFDGRRLTRQAYWAKYLAFSVFHRTDPKKSALALDKYAQQPVKTKGQLSILFFMRRTFQAQWFREHCQLEFEGKLYSAPKMWHEILSHTYGNYMQLPPTERQVSNHDFTLSMREASRDSEA